MQLAARSTAIVGILASAAIAAPAASAQFNLEPGAAAQVHSATAGPRPEVHPNPDEQGASARLVGPPILRPARASELETINRAKAQQERALSYGPPATARYSNADTNAYATTARPVAVTAPTVNTPGDGFDYGDAGIGAGISAAIVLLITAGTLTVRRRSEPQHS